MCIYLNILIDRYNTGKNKILKILFKETAVFYQKTNFEKLGDRNGYQIIY